MTAKLHVLLLEDRPDDAELILYTLRRAGYELAEERVETEEAYRAKLQDHPDIILADCSLPQFDALRAQRILKESGIDVPFIVITGTIEEMALECMKQGAADYLLKDRLSRLGEAVKRALRAKGLREEKQKMEAALRESEARFRRLAENAPDIIYRWRTVEPSGFEYISPAVTTLTGYEPEAYYADPTLFIKIAHPEDREVVAGIASGRKAFRPLVFRLIHKNGSVVWIERRSVPVHDNAGNVIATEGIARDITDRKAAEEALLESEMRFRRLAENAPDSIFRYRLEPDPHIEYVNPATAKITGYPIDAFYDDPQFLFKLVHPEDHDLLAQMIAGRLTHKPVTLRFRHPDGDIRWIERRAVPVYDEEDKLVALEGIIRDVTEQKRAEEAEHEQRTLAEALRDTANDLNQTFDLQEIVERVLENVERVVPHDGANIMLVESGVARLVGCRGYYGQHDLTEAIMQLRLPVSTTPNLRTMAETGQPVIATHTHDDPNWLTLPETEWVHSYVGAPIRREGEIIGFLNLDSATAGFFTHTHAERLQAFANQVAIALHNAQLYQAVQQERHIERTLRRAAAVLNSTLQPDEVLHQILTQLGNAIAFDSAAVHHREGTDLVVKTVTGFPNPADLLGLKIPITANLPNAWVIEHKTPLALDDVQKAYPHFRDKAKVYQTQNIHSWLGIPLISNDKVIGMISMDRKEVRPYTDEEISLATTFAHHAATALENARLYRELETYSEMLEQMVEERTARLRRTMKRLEIILENSADGILLLTPDGLLETGNRACYRLFGYRLDEIRNRPPHELFVPEHRDEFSRALKRVIEEKHIQRLECVAQRKNGSQFDVDVAIAPVKESGKTIGIVCSLRDITSFKEVERMKDAFVSNVSHELRTPITNLMLTRDLMSFESDRQDKYMQRLGRELQRLSLIVEDLLRLSRIEQGRLELNFAPCDLNRLIEELSMDRKPMMREKGLALALELESCPPPAWGDAGLLGQVLSILLTNALNYTPQGGEITLGTHTRYSHGQQWVGFTVSDTGPGIQPEDQAHIFERFYRGEAGRLSDAHGTGLGLSIAKQILDRHKGHIEIKSEGIPGEGTTFYVWVPAAKEDQDEA